MNDILRIARLRIALQRAFLGRAILRVIGQMPSLLRQQNIRVDGIPDFTSNIE